MYPRWTSVFLAVNSCIWPGVFLALWLIAGERKHFVFYIAAGAFFGGLIFLVAAALEWRLRCIGCPPKKLVGGGLIMIGWGSLGILCEALFGNGY